MSQSICSTKIAYNTFMIISFLISLFISDCCFFRFIYLYQGIAIDFEVLKGGYCLDYLIVTLCVAFSAFQMFEMDICQ